ncbi:Tn3 family transposase [Streptomyces sp. NPDC006283]|uniref:Tn3 family transposase n=1 Tax=Streptomyces sp. NPDC006283 TaxID=3156741 RepID=UPI0033BBD661
MTNKTEAFRKFSNWLMIASGLLANNDPEDQEKIIKFNELLANCLTFHTAVDITKVVNDLIDAGREIDPVDLATITPYIASKIRRFGTGHLDMDPRTGPSCSPPGAWSVRPASANRRRSGWGRGSRTPPPASGYRWGEGGGGEEGA